MTVDYDCQSNWNKENVHVNGIKKKTVTFQQRISQRIPLAELPIENYVDEMPPSYGNAVTSSAFRVFYASEEEIEAERLKWKHLAAALCCDAEEDDEAMMRELLELCAWNDDHEKPFAACLFGRKGSCETAYESEEDDEDASFLSFIRRQPVPNFHANARSRINKVSAPTEVSEVHVSSLRLKSQLNLFESRGSCGEECLMEGCAGTAGPSDRTLQEMKSTSAGSCRKRSLCTAHAQRARMNSHEKLEQAFFGIVSDDNDAVLTTGGIFKKVASVREKSNASIPRVSENHWADVDFGV